MPNYSVCWIALWTLFCFASSNNDIIVGHWFFYLTISKVSNLIVSSWHNQEKVFWPNAVCSRCGIRYDYYCWKLGKINIKKTSTRKKKKSKKKKEKKKKSKKKNSASSKLGTSVIGWEKRKKEKEKEKREVIIKIINNQ